jgi:hypothetical protein
MMITLDEVMAAVVSDDNIGFCIACGAEHYGVEPDACEYPCESCNAPKVFGAQELLLTMVA